ncbi:MAG: methyltransferase domain-containing protein [Rhodanobacteraceae bacterium]
MLAWLLDFAKTRNVANVLADLPSGERAQAEALLRHLLLHGVLIAAGNEKPTDADRRIEHANNALKALAQDVYALAGDLNGMGATVLEALDTTGVAIEDRLDNLRAALNAIRWELASQRAEYLRGQLTKLGLDRQSRGLKLHIGCGDQHLPGWINIDRHPSPLALNLLWGLPFADGSTDFIYLAHFLEHLWYPGEVDNFIGELRRVLTPRGRLRIVVPDIGQAIDAYVRNDLDWFAGRVPNWGGDIALTTRIEHFLAYAGAGPHPAWLLMSHKFGYDYETLSATLGRAGFVDIVRSDFDASAVPELRVDRASHSASARHGDAHYSLFIEASAPA